jgi:hypothetical protein
MYHHRSIFARNRFKDRADRYVFPCLAALAVTATPGFRTTFDLSVCCQNKLNGMLHVFKRNNRLAATYPGFVVVIVVLLISSHLSQLFLYCAHVH